ncbi:hypothetical protein TGVAND_273300 [Toxoplasma gondii VAND]|uniref:Uncharacterized protein n=1 Tax=Toxoplasma gondii VAND TaxID=933077 RepID=A0A086QGC2_TOXGO|nr:hypothetical protein TGVAND_273300 [Toxoplasma gondii VAND]
MNVTVPPNQKPRKQFIRIWSQSALTIARQNHDFGSLRGETQVFLVIQLLPTNLIQIGVLGQNRRAFLNMPDNEKQSSHIAAVNCLLILCCLCILHLCDLSSCQNQFVTNRWNSRKPLPTVAQREWLLSQDIGHVSKLMRCRRHSHHSFVTGIDILSAFLIMHW